MGGIVGFAEAQNDPFSLIGSTSYSLGAGQAKSFTLRYTVPAVAQGHTQSDARLIDLGTGCVAVGLLTVQGTAVVQPACDVSTTSLDFGSVAVGQSKDLSFDIHNSGGGTLCGSVTENATDFSIVQNASYCITPPGFVRVTVRFTPSATGVQTISISAGAGCPAISARGTGT